MTTSLPRTLNMKVCPRQQLEDVPIDREVPHLRAGPSDGLAQPQQTEITIAQGDQSLELIRHWLLLPRCQKIIALT